MRPLVRSNSAAGALPWSDTMNLFDHYQKDPRGADNYPQWCRDRIWELLQKPARIHQQAGGVSMVTVDMPLHEAIKHVSAKRATWHCRAQIKLLDGTTVKEWGGT
jgi:hypothetical protein